MSRSRGSAGGAAPPATTDANNPQASRETVESIVVAVILAFLFRAFVAEAFVIPTGSMAPTLQGRHLDLDCVQCGYRYRTGASMENEGRQVVDRTTCPICRFELEPNRSAGTFLKTNQDSFNGDRILVSKFAYELSEPERWDVIVFKYPGNAKQNYIKRLVGLPGETIWIQNGDIFAAPGDPQQTREQDREFQIVRKPPSKVQAMLQVVDDTKYIGDKLLGVGWPSRWNQGVPTEEPHRWKIAAGNQQFTVAAGEQVSWLRYRHLIPSPTDWEAINLGQLPERVKSGKYGGQLITDYYAYNDFSTRREEYPMHYDDVSSVGSCWVGDLSVVCDVEVQSDSGELLLDLVEGGVAYRCRIDVATGVAELSFGDGSQKFEDGDGNQSARPTAATPIRGAGRHRLQFGNVDDQLLLWVDSKRVEFDGPTTYIGALRPPVWKSLREPGDLAPVGIGGRNVSLGVTRLQILRDVYYQAVDHHSSLRSRLEYGDNYQADELRRIFADPDSWAEFFANRPHVEFPLGEDQYFPLGDNSPQSKDARLWSDGYTEAYVERRLLLGKALLIYWPHAWRPFLPNFARMGFIK